MMLRFDIWWQLKRWDKSQGQTMKVRYLLACLFVVKHVIPQNAQEINGDILARELNKVADSVGWSFLQVQLL